MVVVWFCWCCRVAGVERAERRKIKFQSPSLNLPVWLHHQIAERSMMWKGRSRQHFWCRFPPVLASLESFATMVPNEVIVLILCHVFSSWLNTLTYVKTDMTRQLQLRKAKTSYAELILQMNSRTRGKDVQDLPLCLRLPWIYWNQLQETRTRTGKIRTRSTMWKKLILWARWGQFITGQSGLSDCLCLSWSTSTKSRIKKLTSKDKGKRKTKAESAEGPTVSQVPRLKGKCMLKCMLFRRQVFITDIERSRYSLANVLLSDLPCLSLPTWHWLPVSRSGPIKLGVSISATVLYGTWLKTKEAITTGNNTDTEAKRGPRIYPDIRVQDGWEIMSLEFVPLSFAKFFGINLNFRRVASSYLLTNDVITEDCDLKPPSSVFPFLESIQISNTPGYKGFFSLFHVCLPNMILFFCADQVSYSELHLGE